MTGKFKVLVICTGNACRSQMAEGLIRLDMGDRVDVESAGVLPCFVHPLAIAVLAESGMDISEHRSKHVKEFVGEDFDLFVTICSNVRDICGTFPWAKEQFHMEFDDPTGTLGTDEKVLDAFRKTRDEIRERLLPFIEEHLHKRVPEEEQE